MKYDVYYLWAAVDHATVLDDMPDNPVWYTANACACMSSGVIVHVRIVHRRSDATGGDHTVTHATILSVESQLGPCGERDPRPDTH
jgi:hypothetical protein